MTRFFGRSRLSATRSEVVGGKVCRAICVCVASSASDWPGFHCSRDIAGILISSSTVAGQAQPTCCVHVWCLSSFRTMTHMRRSGIGPMERNAKYSMQQEAETSVRCRLGASQMEK